MKDMNDCVPFAETPFCCKLKEKDEATEIRYSGAVTVGFPYGRSPTHTQALPLCVKNVPVGTKQKHTACLLSSVRSDKTYCNTTHAVVLPLCV